MLLCVLIVAIGLLATLGGIFITFVFAPPKTTIAPDLDAGSGLNVENWVQAPEDR